MVSVHMHECMSATKCRHDDLSLVSKNKTKTVAKGQPTTCSQHNCIRPSQKLGVFCFGAGELVRCQNKKRVKKTKQRQNTFLKHCPVTRFPLFKLGHCGRRQINVVQYYLSHHPPANCSRVQNNYHPTLSFNNLKVSARHNFWSRQLSCVSGKMVFFRFFFIRSRFGAVTFYRKIF
jgi:hypothetical protein